MTAKATMRIPYPIGTKYANGASGSRVLALLRALLYCYWIMCDWSRRIAALGRRLMKERDRHI